MYGKHNMETHTTVCKIDSQPEFCSMAEETRTGALYQPRGVGWLGRRREVQKGVDTCTPMADSC